MAIINAMSQLSALYIIENSPHSFYLGGSRRIAQIAERSITNHKFVITADTDYDFYATYNDDILNFLIKNGFTETNSRLRYTLDDEAVMILEKDNVQVVLRKNAIFYHLIFENIDPDFYFNVLWKSSPTQPDRGQIQPIFNMLFAIGHAIKGDQLADPTDPQAFTKSCKENA